MKVLGEMFVKGAGAGAWLAGAALTVVGTVIAIAAVCAVLARLLGAGKDDDGL